MVILVALLSLVSASIEDCSSALKADAVDFVDLVTGDIKDDTAARRVLYTGKYINDLGHYGSCTTQKGSKYMIAKLSHKSKSFYVGVCAPEQCSEQDIQTLLSEKSQKLQNSQGVEIVSTKDYNLGFGGVFMLIVAIVLVLFSLAGSLVYALNVPKESSSQEMSTEGSPPSVSELPVSSSVLLNFSLQSSWKALFKDHSSGTTDIFNGVKVMSICWIILGQVYYLRSSGVVNNVEDLPYIAGHATTAFGYGAYFAVDTFFWVGGFLAGYLMLEFLKNNQGNLSLKKLLASKLVRLMPAYLFMLMFLNLLFPSLGSGPVWGFAVEKATKDCSSYWWTNLMFLNNFVPNWEGNPCFGISWYLTNYFQIFLMGIFVTLMYYNLKKELSWAVMLGLCGANLVTRFIIADEYEFTVAAISRVNSENGMFYKITNKPYCNYPPYLIGLFCGFVYLQYSTREVDDPISQKMINFIKAKKWLSFAIFKVGWTIVTLKMFTQVTAYRDIDNDYKGYSRATNALFIAISPLTIGVAYLMMFMPILLGEVKSARKVLGWKPWVPFANLAFSVYLVHWVVMSGLYGAEEYGYNFNLINTIRDFSIALVLSFAGALGLFVFVEAPFTSLHKNFLSSSEKTQEVPLLDN